MNTFRLGNRLKVARVEKSLTQYQLAQLTGVTRQTISSVETGQFCPSALLAFRLARQLDKPIDELFFLIESTRYRATFRRAGRPIRRDQPSQLR